MSYVIVGKENGADVKLYYKDWSEGQPIVFCHGWPLTADAWEDQMIYLGQKGFRCIAHDRRSHGRSSQTWDGNDMDTYADDLAKLINALDLKDIILVGHSTGGGEVVRYLTRHGASRVKKIVLISAVVPYMLKTKEHPEGIDISVFDDIRSHLIADRSQFFKDFTTPFYGANRPNSKVSQGLRDSFWLQGMLGGHKGLYDCIKAFSETDMRSDLTKITVPTLIIQGDEDQIVPFAISGKVAAQQIKNAELKVYKGAPHGLCSTEKEKVNADLLEFCKK